MREKIYIVIFILVIWGSSSLVSFLNTRGIKDLIKDNVKTECLRESK